MAASRGTTQRARGRLTALGIVAVIAVSACSSSASPTPAKSDAGAATQPPATQAASASAAPAAKRFDGVQLTFVGLAGKDEYLKKWTDKFAAETGASVTLNTIPFADLQSKVLTASGTGTYLGDVYDIGTALAGQLMSQDAVLEVPAADQAQLGLDQVAPIFKNQQLSWAGKLYGYPYDGDILTMNYRKDIIADPANQEKFKSQFGYDLAVPTTWQQYLDVAKFFTGWDWGATGKSGYGAVALSKRGEHLWSGFLSFAACYAKSSTDPAFFFDLKTMKPRINNPGFVQALTDYATLQKYAPSDNLNYGWGENLQAFITGTAALDIQWGDVGPAVNDPNQSTVMGKVGYAINPGCTRTYDGATSAWVDNTSPNVAPFLGFGGWIFVVPKATKNAEAAQALAAYLGRPDVRNDAAVTAGTGTNPGNFSILNDIQAWVNTGFTEEDAKAYTSAISDSLKSANAVIDLRIPGAPDYQSALELEVSKALSGQSTPQAALDAVAAAWDKTTDGLGRDKQAAYYAAALGVTP